MTTEWGVGAGGDGWVGESAGGAATQSVVHCPDCDLHHHLLNEFYIISTSVIRGQTELAHCKTYKTLKNILAHASHSGKLRRKSHSLFQV